MVRASRPELIAFLGPSLPRAEAEREIRASAKGAKLSFSLEPPARQGDVWRALARRPRVLALIDGVFESSPSVWHHELLDALDGGVLVFGAASMGALRASELASRGMIGVGRIFARYRDGLDDDAAVALLHADAEHDFRPLTVAAVNAEHAIDEARRARALTAAEAGRMREASARLHYQERRWPQIIEAAKLSPAARVRWDAFTAKGLPDLKASDARLCLREAARAAIVRRTSGAPPLPPLRSPPPAAHVRAARAALLEREQATEDKSGRAEWRDSHEARRAWGIGGRRPDGPHSSNVHEHEHENENENGDGDGDGNDARARCAASALRTLLLAATARAAGLAPSPADLLSAESSLLPSDPARRESLLSAAGLAEDELRRAVETLALESLALRHSARLVPDGPSPLEARRLASLLAALAPPKRHR